MTGLCNKKYNFKDLKGGNNISRINLEQLKLNDLLVELDVKECMEVEGGFWWWFGNNNSSNNSATTITAVDLMAHQQRYSPAPSRPRTGFDPNRTPDWIDPTPRTCD